MERRKLAIVGRKILGPGLIEAENDGRLRIIATNFVDGGNHQSKPLLLGQRDRAADVHSRRTVPDLYAPAIANDRRLDVLRQVTLDLREVVFPKVQPIGQVLFIKLKQWSADHS